MDVSCRAGRPLPTPTPSAGMQAASRLMLRPTAAVMQPSLQKGVSSPAHQLTHFTGKLLPNSQSSRSAGPGLDGCHDRVSPDSVVNRITNHKCMFIVFFLQFVFFKKSNHAVSCVQHQRSTFSVFLGFESVGEKNKRIQGQSTYTKRKLQCTHAVWKVICATKRKK